MLPLLEVHHAINWKMPNHELSLLALCLRGNSIVKGKTLLMMILAVASQYNVHLEDIIDVIPSIGDVFHCFYCRMSGPLVNRNTL